MDGNNCNAAQPQASNAAAVAAPAPASGDWRTQLHPYNRQLILNKIMEVFRRRSPFCGAEGLQELMQTAVIFEEKVYTAATSLSDYLRMIYGKLLPLERESQNHIPNSVQANVANNQNPQVTGSHLMQPQVTNQGLLFPVPMITYQPQAQQQLLSQNIVNNITLSGVPSSSNPVPSIPNVGYLAQPVIPNAVGQNSYMQNVQGFSSVTQSSGGNTQRQMQNPNLQIVRGFSSVTQTSGGNTQRQMQNANLQIVRGFSSVTQSSVGNTQRQMQECIEIDDYEF